MLQSASCSNFWAVLRQVADPDAKDGSNFERCHS
jgi:hypothetical protein